jgi:hypothetical protein
MRLLKSQIEQKTGAGFATLLPEEPEDMVSEGIHLLVVPVLTTT